MQSWSDAEHLVRGEAARLVVPGDVRPQQLIAVVGARAPTAVITSRAPGPEGTRRALAELVALAAEGFAAPVPERLHELVDHCLAAGHRVRLAATSPLPG